MPSPMPIRVWTPTMAARTVPIGAPPVPPMAYSSTKAAAASTTEMPAAIPDAATTEVLVAGRTRRSRRKVAQPPNTPTTAMLVMLSPSAVSPPSANRLWTTRTTATQMQPAHGPTSTAARTPPSRWPLVPAATGKLSICTAKM